MEKETKFITPTGTLLPMNLQFFGEKNIVTFGLEQCYYAKATLDSTTGVVTYSTPKPYPGATELTLEINGDLIEFEADNIIYYSAPDNKGYTGTFTAALVPDDFQTEILGETIDEDDGVQTETSNDSTSPFALMFQFEGDAKAVRHVLYWCSANRTGSGSATGKNINTTELNFNSTPRPSDKSVKSKTTPATKATIYDGWFNDVYEKTGGA